MGSLARMTPEFKNELSTVLKTMKKPANEKFQMWMEVLNKHKLSYTIRAHCRYFLEHKSSRGGLMVSPHNVHRNGSNIHQVGADLKQLTNAVCIELAPLVLRGLKT